MVLTETWHQEGNSVATKRLRGSQLNVVEAARQIQDASCQLEANFVNHGGLAIVASRGVNISKVTSKHRMTTFEHLCCRIGGSHGASMLAAVYRPGSQPCVSGSLQNLPCC